MSKAPTTDAELLDFYRNCTERASAFITKHIHPNYGPCDGFADGECSECLRVLDLWRNAYALQTLRGSVVCTVCHLRIPGGDWAEHRRSHATKENHANPA